jgi:hypothetical protein
MSTSLIELCLHIELKFFDKNKGIGRKLNFAILMIIENVNTTRIFLEYSEISFSVCQS